MTNQNDTQDEAERLAMECGNAKAIPVIRSMYPSKSRGEMAREFAQVFKEGYRAGKEPQLNLNRMLLSTNGSLKETVAALQEELNQSKRETQAAVHLCEQSRAEVEQLKQELIHETKGTAYCICGERGIEREFDYICEPCGRSWMSAKQIASYDLKLLVDLREQLAAEKARSQKLVGLLREAVEFMKRPPAISTGDRAWHQHDVIIQIDKTLSDYSTDSGDGET